MCYKFLSFEMSNVTHALGRTSINLLIHIMCPILNFEYFEIFVYSSKPVKTEKKFCWSKLSCLTNNEFIFSVKSRNKKEL